jgi:hypothetical protein
VSDVLRGVVVAVAEHLANKFSVMADSFWYLRCTFCVRSGSHGCMVSRRILVCIAMQPVACAEEAEVLKILFKQLTMAWHGLHSMLV